MRKAVRVLTLVLCLSGTALAEVTKEDLKKLSAAQISDGVILAYIRSHGPVPKMSAQDLIELKNAGVSEKVLEVIASGDPRPAPVPARTEVIERRIHVVSPPAVVDAPRVWCCPWRPSRPWVRVGFCW